MLEGVPAFFAASTYGPLLLAVMAAVRAAGGDLGAAGLALAEMAGMKGRGARHTLIVPGGEATLIDESYNANPASMRAALSVLGTVPRAEFGRRIAVLGEMGELGDDAISEHDRIGRLAVRLDVSRLVVVGTGRSVSAMHHAAVMEGSWGASGDRGAVNVADGDADDGQQRLVRWGRRLAVPRRRRTSGQIAQLIEHQCIGL